MESARRLTPPPRLDSDAPPSGVRTMVPRPAPKGPASIRPLRVPPPLLRPSAPPPSAPPAEEALEIEQVEKLPPPLPRRAPPPPPSARAAVKPRAPRADKLDPATRPSLKTIVNEGMTAPPVVKEAPARAPQAEAPAPRPALAPPPPIPSSQTGSLEKLVPPPTPSQAVLAARTFATTAQDWPIAQVPSAPGLLEPGFGSPPKTVAADERASVRPLPAFLPPAEMMLLPTTEAANDGVRVESLARADDEVAPVVRDMSLELGLPTFVADEVESPVRSPLWVRLTQLPRWACFAAGLAAGVVVTLVAS